MSDPTVHIQPFHSVGVTLSTNLNPSQPPFDATSMSNVFGQFDKKEMNQLGTQELKFTVTMTEDDRTKALGVAGQLDMSYGPASGDANVKFSMDHSSDQFSTSMIYNNTVIGAQRRCTLTELNGLKLTPEAQTVAAKGASAFTSTYGRYVIIGFEYGAQVLFNKTFSATSSSDKTSVHGGLSVKYNKVPGFSVSGSVNGDYSTADASKASNSKADMTVTPNPPYAISSALKDNFNTLTSSDATVDEMKAAKKNLDDTISKFLGSGSAKNFDAVNSIVLPITSVQCVSNAILDGAQKAKEMKGFCKFANELYLTVLSYKSTVDAMTQKWTEDPPTDLLLKYGSKLERLQQVMYALTPDDLAQCSTKYHDYIIGGSGDNMQAPAVATKMTAVSAWPGQSCMRMLYTTQQVSKAKDADEEKGGGGSSFIAAAAYDEQIDIPSNEFYKISLKTLKYQFKTAVVDLYNAALEKSEMDKLKYDPKVYCKIAIVRNWDGKYESATKNFEDPSTTIGAREVFTSLPLGDGRVALMTCDGTYVTISTEDGAYNHVNVDARSCSKDTRKQWAWLVESSDIGYAFVSEYNGFSLAGTDAVYDAPWLFRVYFSIKVLKVL